MDSSCGEALGVGGVSAARVKALSVPDNHCRPKKEPAKSGLKHESGPWGNHISDRSNAIGSSVGAGLRLMEDYGSGIGWTGRNSR